MSRERNKGQGIKTTANKGEKKTKIVDIMSNNTRELNIGV
jgi:hypothetical protein